MPTWVEQAAAETRALYESKLMEPTEAVKIVESGDRIWIPVGHSVDVLLGALTARAHELRDVTVSILAMNTFNWFEDGMREHINVDILYCTPMTREAVNSGQADFSPWWIWGGHKGLDDGREDARPVDTVFIQVGTPTPEGNVCIGTSLWDSNTTARRARKVVAVVNASTLTTYGDTWMHISEFDAIVEMDVPPPSGQSFAFPPPTEEQMTIAGYAGSLVKDGDTIQIGTGSTTGAIVRSGVLDDKQDLGHFGELTVPGTIELVQKGVITGKYMNTHPGKFVAATAGNSPEDFEFINGNPAFEFYPVEYMHHPGNIGANEDMVAINNALGVDLGGQIAATTLGAHNYSGTGGHIAYSMGAFLSPGGRYICCLPSTARDGTVSRIQGLFPEGQVVTVQRELADYVVTEYGIASLLNRTLRERARELIAVAHPDHRADLTKQAEKLYGAL